MRVFTASLATETNTFAPIPTDLRSFQEAGFYPPGAHPDGPTLTTSPLWVLRRRVGPEVPIGAELDPHCHMTDRMVEAADLLICYKEFPHTDFVERAEEVVELTLRTARGEIRPRMSLFDCRMIGSFPTSREPMRSFVDGIKAREGKDGILSISIAHGFPFGD